MKRRLTETINLGLPPPAPHHRQVWTRRHPFRHTAFQSPGSAICERNAIEEAGPGYGRLGRLGGLRDAGDVYNSHLDYDLVPAPSPCNPMTGKSGLPACQRFDAIRTSANPEEAAKQYIGRFFRVAVKYGLLSPDKTPLREMFNESARRYKTAFDRIGQWPIWSDGDESILRLVAAADENQMKALRAFESTNPTWRMPVEDLAPEVRLVTAPVTVAPLPGDKKSTWKYYLGAAALAGGIFWFATMGVKDEPEDSDSDDYSPGKPPMSGT